MAKTFISGITGRDGSCLTELLLSEGYAVHGIVRRIASPCLGYLEQAYADSNFNSECPLLNRGDLMLGDTGAQRDWVMPVITCAACGWRCSMTAPKIFVFATGRLHGVQEAAEIAFRTAGLDWRRQVRHDPKFFRPAEPPHLAGNTAKARRLLNWQPKQSSSKSSPR